jgi:hypothetical protein
MSPVRLHQFSPQRSNPDDLEAITVARSSLLDSAIEKIRNSAVTKNRYHLLYFGQRGIGKTHMIALINRRIEGDKALRRKVRIAWLNEDETSSRFLHLLIRIYRSLSARYPDEFPEQEVQGVLGLDAREALAKLSISIVQRAKGRTILLLIENLDAHFAKFSIEEQRNWRGFMQDHPIFTTVATAQGLFDGVKKHDEPFFGFFDAQHLQPLSFDETSEMLMKIAVLQENEPMQRMLGTAQGRSRLRVIHFLAGGNPRLYVLLSELITDETLMDVVDTFEAMVDQQLTSYYQERLRWLAPLQQDIVQVLCRSRTAVSVNHIAKELFTTNQSVSGQLKDLRSLGYVTHTKVGRETWYELAEPLMRLVMEVKETGSHRPLSLLVEFLQAWFERDELRLKLGLQERESTSWRYLETALSTYDEFIERWPELRGPSGLLTERPITERLTHFMQSADANQLVSVTTSLLERSAEVEPSVLMKGIFFRQLGWIALGEYSKALDDISLMLKLQCVYADRSVCVSLLLFAIQISDYSHWEKAIGLLLEKANVLGIDYDLDNVVLLNISVLEKLFGSGNNISDWNEVWQRLGKNDPHLLIPLRMLDAATKYLMSKKQEVLLSLPLEERKFLTTLLDLP